MLTVRAWSSNCTMSGLLHVLFSDERVTFHVMVELTVRKEDTLDCRQIKAVGELLTRVTTSPTRKVQDVFQNNRNGFVTLLLRQARHFDCRLNCREVLTKNTTHVCAQGLQLRLIHNRDAQDVVHLQQDLHHVIVKDIELTELRRVINVRRLWNQSRKRSRGRSWEGSHADMVSDMVNGLTTVTRSRQRRSGSLRGLSLACRWPCSQRVLLYVVEIVTS